ncbi:MAG: DUF47 family protein [Candidatus Lokiarchaeota archaeon]|nr:DUF47 family protein [Candidatus Lokiarchaeota archaeon]
MLVSLLKQAQEMEELVEQVCDGSPQARVNVTQLVTAVIRGEKEIDRLKEAFTEKLYKEKGFLPNIQKNDYLYICESIDDIADEVEIVGRQFQIYSHDFPQSVKMDFISLARAVNNTIKRLSDQVTFLFKDFSRSNLAWERTQAERRNAREVSWSLYQAILSMDLNHKDLLMQRALVKSLIAVADKAERFSDAINALVIKYLTLD